MKILMTGGTGFIGSFLCPHLLRQGHELTILSRQVEEKVRAICGAAASPIPTLASLTPDAHFDAVINLAGEGIADQRWSDARKKKLLDSRIGVTANLIDAIGGLEHKPKVLISGSAVGFYGNQGDQVLDEEAGAVDDFSHQMCAAWEAGARHAEDLGIRVCIVRTGLVVGQGGGFLSRMLPLFKLGLGGPIGNGGQWMSWIHRSDHVALTEFLLNHPALSGVFNATTPNPVTNREFSQCLAKLLNRPAFLPVPAAILRLALGEMAELLLGGQRVLPGRLQDAGFEFRYPKLEETLAEALGLS